MDKLKAFMRKQNFVELFRMYAHGLKQTENYEPFKDLVTKGKATVSITIQRGQLIFEYVEVEEVTEVEPEKAVEKPEEKIRGIKEETKTSETVEKMSLTVEPETSPAKRKPRRK